MIKSNLQGIIARIGKAAIDCGRDPESVQLVAVSKTVPSEKVREAIDAGVTILGENYVQEARDKIAALDSCPVSWHFIGHLQSNKAKIAVKLFDLIHSVDSLKLAAELNKQAKKLIKVQKILVQVNIAQEATKSGLPEQDAPQLIKEISRLENVAIKGLMTMPPYFNAPQRVRPFFKALRKLEVQIKKLHLPAVSMDELSMGMTGDFEVAIAEGATLVRIGTAIFGDRD